MVFYEERWDNRHLALIGYAKKFDNEGWQIEKRNPFC